MNEWLLDVDNNQLSTIKSVRNLVLTHRVAMLFLERDNVEE